MRVAYITTVAEFVRYILVHDLKRLGGRVDPVILCAPGPEVAGVTSAGFRVVEVPIERKLAPWRDVRALWALVAALRRERPEIVHTWMPKAGLLGQMAAWIARVPVRIHANRGLLYTDALSARRKALYRLTDVITYRCATRTLFNSAADMEVATKGGLCPPERAAYTGSGIDLDYFTRTNAVRDRATSLHAELGIPGNARIVLAVGRFTAEKGFLDIIAAAAIVARQRGDVHFVLVAPAMSGEAGVIPDSAIGDAAVARVITRIGAQGDVRPFFAMADVFVHASHREGVPRVVMEAAAMGTPIVASDIAGCREVVRHEHTALLFPVRDPEALAAAIVAVLDDPDAARRRAARAGLEVRAKFDQDAHAERLWNHYQAALGRSDEPGGEGPPS